MPRALPYLLAATLSCLAADPTYLKRSLATAKPQTDSPGVTYKPLFGTGDPDARHLKSIARYGELTIEPNATATPTQPANEEQLYFILGGTGEVTCDGQKAPVKPNDFLYLPPATTRSIAAKTQLRLLVMGFRVPKAATPPPASKLLIANTADVPFQTLPSHGPTTQFALLVGTTESKRDKLAAASQMVSLFIMDFAPGGTNIPHHHETEEEIYFVMKGSGEMVAGGGIDGNEGRYPTKEGDAWFVRLNTTVGFYSGAKPGSPHDQILAVRSTFPFPRRTGTQ